MKQTQAPSRSRPALRQRHEVRPGVDPARDGPLLAEARGFHVHAGPLLGLEDHSVDARLRVSLTVFAYFRATTLPRLPTLSYQIPVPSSSTLPVYNTMYNVQETSLYR